MHKVQLLLEGYYTCLLLLPVLFLHTLFSLNQPVICDRQGSRISLIILFILRGEAVYHKNQLSGHSQYLM